MIYVNAIQVSFSSSAAAPWLLKKLKKPSGAQLSFNSSILRFGFRFVSSF